MKQNLILADLDDAVQGKVDMKATIPDFLTPQRVLELDKETKNLVLKIMNRISQELVQAGDEASPRNPLFLKKLNDSTGLT